MLKKAGIVVAAATAGLLAIAPLAFAGDKSESDHRSGPRASYSYTGVDVEDDSATCEFGTYASADTTQTDDSGAFALLGAATSGLAQALAPVTSQVQAIAPLASCNDITIEDNTQDNDTTVSG